MNTISWFNLFTQAMPLLENLFLTVLKNIDTKKINEAINATPNAITNTTNTSS